MGERLGGASLWTSQPLAGKRSETTASDSKSATFDIEFPSTPRSGLIAAQLATTNGVSDFLLLALDPLPTGVGARTNTALASAQSISVPLAVDATAAEANSHFYRFAAHAGQRLVIEVLAARAGSPIDPVLRLLDSSGRELAYNEDFPTLGPDARLDFTVPESGEFVAEVRDTQYRGGPEYFYRFRASEVPIAARPLLITGSLVPAVAALTEVPEVEPNDDAARAMPITVPTTVRGEFGAAADRDWFEFHAEKDQRFIITGQTRSIGQPCDLWLQLFDADGKLLAESNPNTADDGAITNKFTSTGIFRLLVEELNQRGGGLGYRVNVRAFEAGFSLSMESNRFAAPPGGNIEFKVTATRREFDAPIILALTADPATFSLTNHIIGAATNATVLRFTLPTNTLASSPRHFRILGRGETTNGIVAEAMASTMPALRARFPLMLHPPRELDGLITLGITAP